MDRRLTIMKKCLGVRGVEHRRVARELIFGAWLLAAGAQAVADPAPLADPTAPAVRNRSAVAAVDAAVEYRLSGIWSRSGRTSAVINGATVTVGDAVAGARVIAIGADLVRLRLGDGTVTTLRDAPQVVRRAAHANQPGEIAARE